MNLLPINLSLPNRQSISEPAEVHIYHSFTTDMQWDMLEPLVDYLDLISKRKILNYSRYIDKVNSIMGRVLLSKAITDYGLVAELMQLRYDKSGKPLYPNLHFSISHTDDLVVLACSQSNEVGIDIEKNKYLDIDLFRSYFCDEEWNLVTILGAEELLRIWTRKEAVFKALGSGLSEKLNCINCLADELYVCEKNLAVKEIEIALSYHCSLCIII